MPKPHRGIPVRPLAPRYLMAAGRPCQSGARLASRSRKCGMTAGVRASRHSSRFSMHTSGGMDTSCRSLAPRGPSSTERAEVTLE